MRLQFDRLNDAIGNEGEREREKSVAFSPFKTQAMPGGSVASLLFPWRCPTEHRAVLLNGFRSIVVGHDLKSQRHCPPNVVPIDQGGLLGCSLILFSASRQTSSSVCLIRFARLGNDLLLDSLNRWTFSRFERNTAVPVTIVGRSRYISYICIENCFGLSDSTNE